MNIGQLKPASELAQRFGVKCLVYGEPGTGKTRLAHTAPNPVMCVIEPGMLSMRDAAHIPAWEANTPERIEEFFTWLFQSPEAKKFDTVYIDSISQIAEKFLERELKRNKDGRKAYGEMSTSVMSIANGLFYMPQKHVVLTAKMVKLEMESGLCKAPYFPGKDLDTKIPHLYDELFYLGLSNVPGQPAPVVGVRTKQTFGITARDKSGKLGEIEPPHLGQIFAKCMS